MCCVTDSPQVTIWAGGREVTGEGLTSHEGDTVNLTCVIDAQPRVAGGDVIWLRNGTRVATGLSYVIRSLQKTDRGVYGCQATNTLQPSDRPAESRTTTHSVQLRVFCKCLNLGYC